MPHHLKLFDFDLACVKLLPETSLAKNLDFMEKSIMLAGTNHVFKFLIDSRDFGRAFYATEHVMLASAAVTMAMHNYDESFERVRLAVLTRAEYRTTPRNFPELLSEAGIHSSYHEKLQPALLWLRIDAIDPVGDFLKSIVPG